MGRILGLRDVAKGQVPTKEQFEQAKAVVRERCLLEGGVKAAMFFGSTVYGAGGPRSDLDVVMVSTDADLPIVRGRMATLADGLMKKYAVPLSVQLVAVDQLQMGLHTLTGPLVMHLRRAAEHEHAMVKGNVLQRLPSPQITQVDVLEYVVKKHHSLQEALLRADRWQEPLLCRLLQKVVEAPLHVARRQLDLAGLLDSDDRGKVVVDRYAKSMPDALRLAFAAAHEANHFYDTQLERHLLHFSAEAYLQVLRRLHDEYALRTLKYLELTMRQLSS